MKEQVVTELKRIYERDGKLRTTAVVSEAKKKTSPLHPEFEWDDSKAGEEYRLIQARQLIRSVRIERPVGDGSTIKEPMFIHVRNEEGQGVEGEYHTRDVLVKHPDMFLRALDEARSILQSSLAAVKQLEDMARGNGKSENTIAIITIAEKGLEAAIEAVKRLEAA